MPGRVVAVVDDDVRAGDVDLVQPAGGQVVGRGERPQALADVVQVRARREGGPGRGQRVGTFILALPPKVAGSRWVQASCIVRRPCRSTIISPRSLRSSTTARPPRRQWSSTISAVSLPASAIVNHTTSPEHRRRIAAHQLVVGVEHCEPVARHGLDDDLLDLGELLEGVDAAHAQVVGRDVEHDRDVVALISQALAQDAAAGDLEDGEVDPRVLQHHPGGLRPAGVGPDHQPLVDHDAVGRGHADLAAHPLEDVGDHP